VESLKEKDTGLSIVGGGGNVSRFLYLGKEGNETDIHRLKNKPLGGKLR